MLLAASVAAELLWPVQRSDGTVVNGIGFALYVAGWLLGTAALVLALGGLGGGAVGAALPRIGRIGRGLGLAGALLLAGFAVVGLGSALATGAPLEASFLLFALGFLLLAVGSLPLGLGLRGTGLVGGWWVAAPVTGAGILIALLVGVDPWHDLGLFLFAAGWVALGLRLRAGVPSPSARSTPVG